MLTKSNHRRFNMKVTHVSMKQLEQFELNWSYNNYSRKRNAQTCKLLAFVSI